MTHYLGPVSSPKDIATKEYVDQAVGGATGTPTGVLAPFAGATAPTGWLLCTGQAVSRTAYANLFAVIGTTYGAGNGTSTFTLPDLRSRVPVGRTTDAGELSTLGGVGGEINHTLTTAEMPAHTHGLTRKAAGSVYQTSMIGADTFGGGDYSADFDAGATKSAGGTAAHNNMPPYLLVNYLIKT